MKISSFLRVTVATFALKFSVLSGHAAPSTNAIASSNIVQKSVFSVPASKKEGCDPFYPTSTRLWAVAAAPGTLIVKSKPTGLDCLVLKGLSGAPANPLAMINGHTMSRGEDAEINTDCGRILVHCVDITSTSAVIEVAGERKELRLRSDL